jgi:hypothetical protein
MKTVKQEDLKELTEKVYELLHKTAIEIGQNPDGKTIASLSKIFANDLQKETRFKNLTFNQVVDGFSLGVRFGKDEPFLNIRTFYKWTYEHKKTIDDAYYQVHTLGQPKEKILYYQEPLKQLK